MSQIPVLKSAAHTHTRKADKAVSTEPFHSSSCCSKCCDVKRWARPVEAFHECGSLNLCYPHTPTGNSLEALSIPSCAKPFCRDFSPTLPSCSHSKVFKHPFPKPRAVATPRDPSLAGVFPQGSQRSLLPRGRPTEVILFSLFHVSGGPGRGLLVFVSWLTL